MAYKRKPLYHFADTTETGVDKIPLKRVLVLESTELLYMKENNIGLTPMSTIADAITNGNIIELYINNSDPSYINAPTIITPTDGAIDYNGVIETSSYSTDPSYQEIQKASDWLFSVNSGFSTIDHSSYNDPINLVSYQPTDLNGLTTYYAKCRHKSDTYVSDWSPVISFTTRSAFIEVPTVEVTGAPNSINLGSTIKGSTFNVIGGSDTHISTSYQIVDSLTSAVVWESLNNTTDLNEISIPDSAMEEDTEYQFTVVYNGATLTSGVGSLTGTTVLSFAPVGVSQLVTCGVNSFIRINKDGTRMVLNDGGSSTVSYLKWDGTSFNSVTQLIYTTDGTDRLMNITDSGNTYMVFNDIKNLITITKMDDTRMVIDAILSSGPLTSSILVSDTKFIGPSNGNLRVFERANDLWTESAPLVLSGDVAGVSQLVSPATGSYVYSLASDKVCRIDLQSGVCTYTNIDDIEGHRKITVSRDGKTIIQPASSNDRIDIWRNDDPSIATGWVKVYTHNGGEIPAWGPTAAAVSDSGEFVYTSFQAQDTYLRVLKWDGTTYQETGSIDLNLEMDCNNRSDFSYGGGVIGTIREDTTLVVVK